MPPGSSPFKGPRPHGPSRLVIIYTYPFFIMAAIARVYQAQFDRSPHQTLMVMNGALSALGDACAQAIELFVSGS